MANPMNLGRREDTLKRTSMGLWVWCLLAFLTYSLLLLAARSASLPMDGDREVLLALGLCQTRPAEDRRGSDESSS